MPLIVGTALLREVLRLLAQVHLEHRVIEVREIPLSIFCWLLYAPGTGSPILDNLLMWRLLLGVGIRDVCDRRERILDSLRTASERAAEDNRIVKRSS